MRSRVLAVVLAVAAMAALLLATVLWVRYLSTAVPDRCSEEHDRCASAVDGFLGSVDCRIEVYHCRAFGEFTHPDGTVVRVPTGVER